MEKSLVDILWVITASTLVFFMQPGFAMVESGLTRSKNSINVAIKNLADLGVSTLFFWVSGFALMFGATWNGVFGTGFFLFEPENTWQAVFFVFQVMFCSTSATIVSGAVAERMKFTSYLLSTILLSLVVYPVFGHWAWGGFLQGEVFGWLGKLGFIDFAGSTVVHSLGGWVSLALLLILGPRTGKYSETGESRTINGNNIPIAVLGVFILWFGWFGFNGGSTLAMDTSVASIILNTTLAAAAGMVGCLAIGWPIMKKPDIALVLNGSLAGLVAITAPCHAVTALESVIIGFVGGGVMLGVTWVLDRLKIDDAVGAVPVHLGAGVWGTLAVAFFGDPEILGTGLSMTDQLGVQLLGVAACGMWAFFSTLGVMYILNKFIPLRVSLEHEMEGLNKAEHGVTTEIHDLFYIMEEQSRTGDISLRAPVEPFTEAGQIAGMYNQVLESLEGNTVEIEEYYHILDNVSDGMLLLDEYGAIGPYYSGAVCELLESKDIAGTRLDYLLEKGLPLESVKLFREFFELVLDEKISWRNVERMNPLAEAEFSFDDGRGGFRQKYMTFFFKRVLKEDKIDRVMVIIRDITQQKLLAEEISKTKGANQAEMELFYRILHIEPSLLIEFLEGARQDLQAINLLFKSASGAMNQRLRDIFRHTHSIKGDAQLLKLDLVAEEAQKLEDAAEALLPKSPLSGEDFVGLTLIYSRLLQVVERLLVVSSQWKTFGREMEGRIEEHFLESALTALAERLSERYGKQIRLDFSGFDNRLVSRELRKPIKDILIQLLRNTVYHGIEMPNDRQKQGKNPEGVIRIQLYRKNGRIVLDYTDDGKGLSAELIRDKALRLGVVSAEEASAMNPNQIFRLIFRNGFTTADKVDDVAGRGAGLSLVHSLVKERNAKLGIASEPGKSCRFHVQFPPLEATG